MPEERDIEKSLRAWAKRRREDAGAPVDLHPATRKLLQDEVSRLRNGPRREPGRFARLLWGSPLRLALNLSAVAVLIFAAAVFLPRLQHPAAATFSAGSTMLAENKRMLDQNAQPAFAPSDKLSGSRASPTVEVAPASAAPPPPPELALRKDKSVSNTVTLADNVTMYKTPVTSAVPNAAPSTSADMPLALDAEKLTTRQAGVTDLTTASANQVVPAPAAVVAQKLSWINSPATADRRDGAASKLGAAPMLGSFRTEQSGNQLRVIDADGSAYAGNLTASTDILDSNGAFPAAQTRAFRVTGTNLTLHQPVIFTGNLVFAGESSLHSKKDVSGAVAVSGGIVYGVHGGGFVGGGGGGFGGAGTNRVAMQAGSTVIPASTPMPGAAAQTATVAGALPPQLPSPPQPQFRVEGTALIGTNEIQINAVPVTP
jgi:hypothetical protein